ncbi:MAG: phosphoribosylamine--glycine ligase [Acidimicrobiia bacterium]
MAGLTVLVLGGGGREHALAWGLSRSPEVGEVVAAPGNPGIAALGRCVPVDASDPAAVVALAAEVDADLVVVGPEAPLVAGVVDALEADGRRAFGPCRAGAELEGSKAWMKEVLADAGVPTARHGAFTHDREADALTFLDTLSDLWVIKTDGLAGGKGVVVTESHSEARDAVRSYLSGDAFGDAGRTVVIEEGLTGAELSVLVLCDGENAVPLPPAQDFKRIGDGDAGPNTGGMGAYSPVPAAGAGVIDTVMNEAVGPTLDALRHRGITYRGVLYAGLMLTPDGPKVLEYNVRFGDPECQAVVPRLSSDLAVHCLEAASGSLSTPVEVSDDACVTVVLAADGYPASPRKGDVIRGIDAAEALDGVAVFHAGTTFGADDGEGTVLTAGGRVLAVSALGPDIAAARERAYAAAGLIDFDGVQYRRDIAASAAISPRDGAIPVPGDQ